MDKRKKFVRRLRSLGGARMANKVVDEIIERQRRPARGLEPEWRFTGEEKAVDFRAQVKRIFESEPQR